MDLELIFEEKFNDEIKSFYMNEWPSANQEVFGFTEQSKWKMEEHLITARAEQKILGVAQFRIIGGVGYLSTLLVKEELRGLGQIGEILLFKFENLGKEKGCHKLVLKTYKDSRAEIFFTKHGYQEEAVLINDIHGIDWLMMAKFV